MNIINFAWQMESSKLLHPKENGSGDKKTYTQAEMNSEEAVLKSVSGTLLGGSQDIDETFGRKEVSENKQIMDPATKMRIVEILFF